MVITISHALQYAGVSFLSSWGEIGLLRMIKRSRLGEGEKSVAVER